MGITISDSNNMDAVRRQLRKMNGKMIKAGVFGGGEVEMIAGVHEFGTKINVTPKMRAWFAANGYPLKKETTAITIPERSFLRSGFDENIDGIFEKLKVLLPEVLELNVNADAFMDMVGLELAGKIQEKIRNLDSLPNSQMTIERKGSSNPLIDSTRLVGSIDRRVE